MPRSDAIQPEDVLIGLALVLLIVLGLLAGFAFENWVLLETWVPFAVLVLLIYLFYRLVIAVEFMAYRQ